MYVPCNYHYRITADKCAPTDSRVESLNLFPTGVFGALAGLARATDDETNSQYVALRWKKFLLIRDKRISRYDYFHPTSNYDIGVFKNAHRNNYSKFTIAICGYYRYAPQFNSLPCVRGRDSYTSLLDC